MFLLMNVNSLQQFANPCIVCVFTSATCAQVELVKLTGQQFSSSHILEVYRGSLNQFVCFNFKKCTVLSILFSFIDCNVMFVLLGQETQASDCETAWSRKTSSQG